MDSVLVSGPIITEMVDAVDSLAVRGGACRTETGNPGKGVWYLWFATCPYLTSGGAISEPSFLVDTIRSGRRTRTTRRRTNERMNRIATKRSKIARSLTSPRRSNHSYLRLHHHQPSPRTFLCQSTQKVRIKPSPFVVELLARLQPNTPMRTNGGDKEDTK